MSIYQQASRLKMRFNTSKGVLATEQLWDLSLTTLASEIRTIKKSLDAKTSIDGLDFLEETSTNNTVEQLQFDILKDVYQTKKSEQLSASEKAQAKEHNEKIMALIASKQNKVLEEMSIEDLQKMLK